MQYKTRLETQMSDYKAPLTDIRFALKHVFDMENFWSSLGDEVELDWDTADAVLEEAGKISNTEISAELALPPVKIHCSILAEDAIKAAIDDYKSKNA